MIRCSPLHKHWLSASLMKILLHGRPIPLTYMSQYSLTLGANPTCSPWWSLAVAHNGHHCTRGELAMPVGCYASCTG